MDTKFLSFIWVFTLLVYKTNAVPPEACFANFRWDDCGKPPTPVMYYWKSGSRCEVGLWRGCLPNMNMFADEYECVSTCIFGPRAGPEDFHSHQQLNEYDNMIIDETTEEHSTDYHTTHEIDTNITSDTINPETSTGVASDSTVSDTSDITEEITTIATEKAPEAPEVPEAPKEPETPEVPEAPEEPEATEAPEAPEEPEPPS